MLTRIRIEASGKTAHEVERELRADADAIKQALNIAGAGESHQVIEGTPGKGFTGRLSFPITVRSKITHAMVSTEGVAVGG
jgi:hypothetical protein